jgi:hypothetical protein
MVKKARKITELSIKPVIVSNTTKRALIRVTCSSTRLSDMGHTSSLILLIDNYSSVVDGKYRDIMVLISINVINITDGGANI